MLLSCCLFAAAVIPAEPPSLRELCIRAPAVVLARPADPHSPTSFVVTAVLRGKGVAVGDTVSPRGLAAKDVRSSDAIDPETKKPRLRRIESALLFLRPAT